ncbi:hypothetical protein Mgra_00009554 [Meloidogyne graminicola]|uniref:Uncharacterized protein n=1 Tax=Meloidogyne graminicola TaxID=189291 RepID=A0A8S9Z7L8_9BILA|nr:hypothetical protein Mgra_00009554 [Meloidogyne graminicola]
MKMMSKSNKKFLTNYRAICYCIILKWETLGKWRSIKFKGKYLCQSVFLHGFLNKFVQSLVFILLISLNEIVKKIKWKIGKIS